MADRLTAAIPQQQELALVHGDFHVENVITSPADGRVRAVLDWELCTLGDPLADLGGLFAYWPHIGESTTPVLNLPTLPGFPSRQELATAYAGRTGRSLDALGFWHVLGLWKLAIIAEGVLQRAQAEPRNATPGRQSLPCSWKTSSRALRVADAEGL